MMLSHISRIASAFSLISLFHSRKARQACDSAGLLELYLHKLSLASLPALDERWQGREQELLQF
jgi:hypothetical protein